MAAEIEYSLWSGERFLSTPSGRSRDQRRSASFDFVSDLSVQPIVCPHCKKKFDGHLLAEGSRLEGFKCPHCRLFVPAERANGDDDGSS
jgi:hypothetical protein